MSLWGIYRHFPEMPSPSQPASHLCSQYHLCSPCANALSVLLGSYMQTTWIQMPSDQPSNHRQVPPPLSLSTLTCKERILVTRIAISQAGW